MANIEHVIKLQKLRKKLGEYDWNIGVNVSKDCRFFEQHGRETTERHLSDAEKTLITKVLQNSDPSGNFSMYKEVGKAIKKIVMLRLDRVVHNAAEIAASEAKEVLKVLEETNYR